MRYTIIKYMKDYAASQKGKEWNEEVIAKLRSIFTTLCMMCQIQDEHERATIIYDLNKIGNIACQENYKSYYDYMLALL